MKNEDLNLYIPETEAEKEKVCETVKSILLSKCVEIFSSFEEDRKKGRIRKNEIPPKDAIVYLQRSIQKSQVNDDAELDIEAVFPQTENICAWHLQDGILSLLDDPNTEPNQKEKNIHAMYYKQATFRIRVDADNGQAYLDFTMGPLFGRGFGVDIKGSADAIYISVPRIRWMS